jgi:subtilisin family serine protease
MTLLMRVSPQHNAGEDIRVYPAWNSGLTGKGVVVTVVDDGLEHLHPDLSRAYVCKVKRSAQEIREYSVFFQSRKE